MLLLFGVVARCGAQIDDSDTSEYRVSETTDSESQRMLVHVDQLRYTQAECSRRFRGGPYEGLELRMCIRDLIDGRERPDSDWLTLEVVRKNGRLYSLNNRRLYCLKRLQQHNELKGSKEPVRAWVQVVCTWTPYHSQFLKHFDTPCEGESIKVRNSDVRRFSKWLRLGVFRRGSKRSRGPKGSGRTKGA